MKYLAMLFLLTACASDDNNWDTGANRRQMQEEHQRQEQVDFTNRQLTTPGSSGVGQSQPWH